jgi:galactokinase
MAGATGRGPGSPAHRAPASRHRVVNDFHALFGRAPSVTAGAPGRVNLIGEHTDYNGGFVLPVPLPRRTVVELAPRADRTVRAWSASVPERLEYAAGSEAPGRGWLDYVQGVTAALAAAGHPPMGFDLRITSDVPIGAGVASSAALEIALLRALRDAFGLPLDDVALALVAQRAENEFVGARTGVMDQMAASLGEPGKALFLDTLTLAHESLPLPPDVELVVIDSSVPHAHAGGEYNLRRGECEAACRLLGVPNLRAVTDPAPRQLEEPLASRVRHVVTENARVLAAVDALRAGDTLTLGALLAASHASMRDDYQVSTPEVDALVEIAQADADVLGARLTGGGFGGAVVILARVAAGSAVAARIARAYADRTRRRPTVLLPI